MKFFHVVVHAIAACSWHLSADAMQVSGPVSMASRSTAVTLGSGSEGGVSSQGSAASIAGEAVDELESSALASMIQAAIRSEGPSSSDLVREAENQVPIADALRRLEGKLPPQVASMARSLVDTGEVQAKGGDSRARDSVGFDEEMLSKARGVLNGMVESAWAEMDAKIIECKEYETQNRETFNQVKTDLARLGEDIADLERMKTEANQKISSKISEVDRVQDLLTEGIADYNRIKLNNEAEMTIRQNDLAVVQFIMDITKCPDVGSSSFAQSVRQVQPRMCEDHSGSWGFVLDDPQLQTKFMGMMTPNAKTLFRRTIAGMMDEGNAGRKQSLLQHWPDLTDIEGGDDSVGDSEVDLDPEADSIDLFEDGSAMGDSHRMKAGMPVASVTVTSSHSQQPHNVSIAGASSPVHTEPSGTQWKKCVDKPPECGMLHDTMSLMWGKFKDMIDKLRMEMNANDAAFVDLRRGANEQIQTLGNAERVFNQMLSEAISNMNEASASTDQKVEQQRKLQQAYEKSMLQCKRKISEILFTNVCSVRKVRNSIMTFSTVSPPDAITDCDVSDWVPQPCSMPCDDTCPQEDPYICGGNQILSREILVVNNEFGVHCPVLEMTRKCNQIKCPVDCKMSEWSGWSKCTKECGGGVQGHTRSVLVKVKNGGRSCDTVQEERACNTGSCERDCTLNNWSPWLPCSKACNGGVQERKRDVLVPIRGAGRCPSTRDSLRLQEQICNPQACAGDEICIALMDLVIAIDSSGSIGREGHAAVRDFTMALVDRFRGLYYGDNAMKVGIVEFGNGAIGANDTIAPAISIAPMTHSMSDIKTAIGGLRWQKGFTNMAQALTLADTMLTQKGRSSAQSAVLMITDSKPSFVFQTEQKVKALKRKNVKLFFAPISDWKGKNFELMKHFASAPWETHLVRIPGIRPLTADAEVFVQKCVTTFCPKAISPQLVVRQEEQLGFFLLKSGGRCGVRGTQLSQAVASPAECKDLAEAEGTLAFSFGKGPLVSGRCWSETLQVNRERIAAWEENRRDPVCPEGDWVNDGLFDFYIIVPTMNFLQLTQRPAARLFLK